MKNNDKYFMKLAIKEAKKADNDVFPNPKVGCLIVKDGKVVSKGFHKRFGGRHAEQVAIDSLPQNITKATMYVTLEPCSMCCGLLIHSRIENLIFAALDPKSGAVMSNANLLDAEFINHKVNYSQGPLEKQSSELLKSFFRARRL